MPEIVRYLKEALPYIKKFEGKTFVVKLSGKLLDDAGVLREICGDIVLLDAVGIHVVIVHGAGKQIDVETEKAGIEKKAVNGLRFTDARTLAIVKKVLVSTNAKIVSCIKKSGANVQGIDGVSQSVILAAKKSSGGLDLGFVGAPKKADVKKFASLLANGVVPVVACLGKTSSGQVLNINADEVAVAIAKALKAEKLMILSDVPGILRDKNDRNSLISELTVAEAKKLIAGGVIASGMVPKTLACIDALNSSVKRTHLIDGLEHSLLVEVFTDLGKGTLIRK
ncbi:MAG: acetylglutamate kinase [Candidatus Diapherotrites archaeon]|nr:acetylglutamate kinase [Candidatus Diapherotrites archaeon]